MKNITMETCWLTPVCVCLVWMQRDPLLMFQFVVLFGYFVQFGYNLFTLLAFKGISILICCSTRWSFHSVQWSQTETKSKGLGCLGNVCDYSCVFSWLQNNYVVVINIANTCIVFIVMVHSTSTVGCGSQFISVWQIEQHMPLQQVNKIPCVPMRAVQTDTQILDMLCTRQIKILRV